MSGLWSRMMKARFHEHWASYGDEGGFWHVIPYYKPICLVQLESRFCCMMEKLTMFKVESLLGSNSVLFENSRIEVWLEFDKILFFIFEVSFSYSNLIRNLFEQFKLCCINSIRLNKIVNIDIKYHTFVITYIYILNIIKFILKK